MQPLTPALTPRFPLAGSPSALARTTRAAESPLGDAYLAVSPEADLALVPAPSGRVSVASSAATFAPGSTAGQRLQAQDLTQRVALAAVPGLGSVQAAAEAGDQQEILQLFDRWNQALATGDPARVAAEYAPDAVLLPTVSNRVRTTPAEIEDYFVHFLAKGPQGKIDQANVRRFGDLAINSGIYTFGFANGEQVQARYSFVYRFQDQEWKIVEHHSSAMPEKATRKTLERLFA